jgi:hypothetical protein
MCAELSSSLDSLAAGSRTAYLQLALGKRHVPAMLLLSVCARIMGAEANLTSHDSSWVSASPNTVQHFGVTNALLWAVKLGLLLVLRCQVEMHGCSAVPTVV